MYMLAGLLGMMALGSMAIIAIGPPEDDDFNDPTFDPDTPDPVHPSSAAELAFPDPHLGGTDPAPDPSLSPAIAQSQHVPDFDDLGPDPNAVDLSRVTLPPTVPPDDLDPAGAGDTQGDQPERATAELTKSIRAESSLFSRMGLINLDPDQVGEDLERYRNVWDASAKAGDRAPNDAFTDGVAFAGVPMPDPIGEHEGRHRSVEMPKENTPLSYDSFEDQLVIVYDDSGDQPDPKVEMRLREGDPALTDIVLDGFTLATLPTNAAPPLSSVVLVGESAAGILAQVA